MGNNEKPGNGGIVQFHQGFEHYSLLFQLGAKKLQHQKCGDQVQETFSSFYT